VPYENDKGYPNAREKAEALLASRKNTRDFDQHVGSNKPKLSLDGFRESVIPNSEYPSRSDPPSKRKSKIFVLLRKHHDGEAEQLSSVDLLKRLGSIPKTLKFPSTSDPAADSFFMRINSADPTKSKELAVIKQIKEDILNPNWEVAEISENRSLVFESRLVEFLPTKEERDQARKKLSDLLEPYVGNIRPNQYYALIIADGDNMGKLIDSIRTPQEHRDLSKEVSDFALSVPWIF
jgi:CRISPR-associated protein Cmr2